MKPPLGIAVLALISLIAAPRVEGAPSPSKDASRLPESGQATGRPTIRLDVDATEAPGHILHARERMSVEGGTLTLLYPKWIPGWHAPNGPLVDVAGFHVKVGGKDVAWRRDLLESYRIRCDLPSGAREADVTFDYLIPFGEGARRQVSSTSHILALDWNQVVFYPEGPPAENIVVQASLRLPPGWRWGTALPVASASGDRVTFDPAPLTTLIDSPVLAGMYFKVVKLAPDLPVSHEMDIAADSPDALEMGPDLEAHYDRLVREENAMFGAHHYRDYHFLLALSDAMSYSGVEHHESSMNRAPERALVDPAPMLRTGTLLSHEMAHSWNGKYRRPADLASAPYLEPQGTDLLWVYEGLTEYLSWVFATRSGLLTADQSREWLADGAATMDSHRGRTWRPLIDTAISEPLLSSGGTQWGSWRRGTDYYTEGILLWLDVDATIREQSGGKRSLDDFCADFYGGESRGPELKTYTLDDVVASLNRVAPYDWKGFFDARLERVTPHPPLGGMERDGWKLAYRDSLSMVERASEQVRKNTSFLHSLGMILDHEATITDIVPEMPAGRAGLSPGMKVIAVNSKAWSPDVARSALREAKKSSKPIEVLAQAGNYFQTYSIDYHGGDRHPVLVRDPGRPDVLATLLRAHTLRPSSEARASGGKTP